MRRSIVLFTEKTVIDKAKEKLASAAGTVKDKVHDLKEAAGQKLKESGESVRDGDVAQAAQRAGQKMSDAGLNRAGESVKHGDTAEAASKAGQKLKEAGQDLKRK